MANFRKLKQAFLTLLIKKIMELTTSVNYRFRTINGTDAVTPVGNLNAFTCQMFPQTGNAYLLSLFTLYPENFAGLGLASSDMFSTQQNSEEFATASTLIFTTALVHTSLENFNPFQWKKLLSSTKRNYTIRIHWAATAGGAITRDDLFNVNYQDGVDFLYPFAAWRASVGLTSSDTFVKKIEIFLNFAMPVVQQYAGFYTEFPLIILGGSPGIKNRITHMSPVSAIALLKDISCFNHLLDLEWMHYPVGTWVPELWIDGSLCDTIYVAEYIG